MNPHGDHGPAVFRRRFWLSLILSVPLVVTSPMVGEWLGYTLDVPGLWPAGPVLGSISYFYAGRPFLAGAFHEIHHRAPGMMLLISMAITVAYAASLATTLGWFDLDFWWELATLVTVMLLGHWQETRALGQARGALSAPAGLLPDRSERLDGDGAPVPTGELRIGDVVLVRPGGRVPADGSTGASWLGDVNEAVVRTVTVLVIACPHALGLAIPLVVALSTAIAARAGILVKDRLALERMRTVDTVLFDKTGTLTTGAPALVAGSRPSRTACRTRSAGPRCCARPARTSRTGFGRPRTAPPSCT